MTTATDRPKPKVRHKTFEYRTSVRWTGGRMGILSSDGKQDIPVSSPPEFKGDPGQWTPEDLLVASLEICTMTTFIAFSMHRKLLLKSYESAATGTMEFVDGKYRFTRITLSPVIVVEDERERETAAAILEEAHHSCFITNSVCSDVLLEPIIKIAE